MLLKEWRIAIPTKALLNVNVSLGGEPWVLGYRELYVGGETSKSDWFFFFWKRGAWLIGALWLNRTDHRCFQVISGEFSFFFLKRKEGKVKNKEKGKKKGGGSGIFIYLSDNERDVF